MMFEIDKREEVCANCQHFCQHYIKEQGRILTCNAGHCIYPRLKGRKPGDTCKNFKANRPRIGVGGLIENKLSYDINKGIWGGQGMLEKYRYFYDLYLKACKDAYDPEDLDYSLKKCIRLCKYFEAELTGMVNLLEAVGEMTEKDAVKEKAWIAKEFSSMAICNAYITEGTVMPCVECQ